MAWTGTRPRFPSSVDWAPRCRRGPDTGAALVDYALVVALVATVAAGGLQALGDRAVEDLQRHASCVAERPVPPECRNPVANNSADHNGVVGS